MELLCFRSWAERGLKIRCGQCRIRSFVPLPETRPEPQCPACGATNTRFEPADGNPDSGPEVHYRLSALVDQGSASGANTRPECCQPHSEPHCIGLFSTLQGRTRPMGDGRQAPSRYVRDPQSQLLTAVVVTASVGLSRVGSDYVASKVVVHHRGAYPVSGPLRTGPCQRRVVELRCGTRSSSSAGMCGHTLR